MIKKKIKSLALLLFGCLGILFCWFGIPIMIISIIINNVNELLTTIFVISFVYVGISLGYFSIEWLKRGTTILRGVIEDENGNIESNEENNS